MNSNFLLFLTKFDELDDWDSPADLKPVDKCEIIPVINHKTCLTGVTVVF